jgi:cytochrome c-type biogenesis protein CcmH
MTLFWTLATALVVVVLLALLRPLLRPPSASADTTAASNLGLLREQMAELDTELAAGRLDTEQHAVARAELEHRVLDETRVADTAVTARPSLVSALVLAVAVPSLAVVLYAQLGNRDALDPALAQAPAPHAMSEDVESLVQRLADRMAAQPEDPAGWALLARSYAGLQRFDKARDAYAQAVRRQQPPDAQLLADYADVLAMTQGRTLAGEPEKLVLQALALDPDHLKALALAGSAAMERSDYKLALKHWTRAKAAAPADSPFATGLDAAIAEARAGAGLPADAPPAPAVAAAPALRVTVTLAPALAAKVQPGDTLFVFARAAEGPRMPLAIVRQPAGTAPVQVVLDDSSAMAPQFRISGFPQVVVGARISRTGNATPQAGDLEGQGQPIASAGSTAVVIDRIRD